MSTTNHTTTESTDLLNDGELDEARSFVRNVLYALGAGWLGGGMTAVLLVSPNLTSAEFSVAVAAVSAAGVAVALVPYLVYHYGEDWLIERAAEKGYLNDQEERA